MTFNNNTIKSIRLISLQKEIDRKFSVNQYFQEALKQNVSLENHEDHVISKCCNRSNQNCWLSDIVLLVVLHNDVICCMQL